MLKHFDAPRPTVAALSAALAALGLAAHPVLAADDVSRWDGDARSAARLIAGAGTPDQHALRAGVEIRLTAGWHTYWRYPGDAGVPPSLDFANSQNVKTVDVLWPAPQRLSEDGLTTIGYDHDVILPIEVTPQDPTKAVGLRLKLGYAICEKLCVPAEAKLALMLASGASAADAALSAAEARVPRKRALGEDDGGVAIRAIHTESGGEHPRVLVDVANPDGAMIDLYAEGPTPQWALPVPARVDGAPPGQQRFAFELDGAPPGAVYKGALVTLTAATDRHAIEVAFHLE